MNKANEGKAKTTRRRKKSSNNDYNHNKKEGQEVSVKKLYIKICLATDYLGVLVNSLKRVRVFQIEYEFGSVGF